MAAVCLGLWMKWPPDDLSCRLAALLEQTGGCRLSDVNTAERQDSSVTVRSVARWLWSTQHDSSLQWSSRRGARSTTCIHHWRLWSTKHGHDSSLHSALCSGARARQHGSLKWRVAGRYPVILTGVDVGAVGDVHDAGDLVPVPAGVSPEILTMPSEILTGVDVGAVEAVGDQWRGGAAHHLRCAPAFFSSTACDGARDLGLAAAHTCLDVSSSPH